MCFIDLIKMAREKTMTFRKIINWFFHKGIDECKKLSVLEYMFNQKMLGNKYAKDFLSQSWYRDRWRYNEEDRVYYDEFYSICMSYKEIGVLKNEEQGWVMTEAGMHLYTTHKNLLILKHRTWIAFVTAILSMAFSVLTFYCKC